MKRIVQNGVIILAVAIISAFPSLELTAKKGLKIDYSAYEKKGKLEMVLQNGHSDDVEAVSFSPDGDYLISGSIDGTIKLWRIDGRLIRTINGSSMIYSVAFSPDGKFIAGGGDNAIRMWSISGKPIRTFKGGKKGNRKVIYPTINIHFSPDGNYIAGRIRDKIMLWSIDGELNRTINLDKGYRIEVMSITPDSKYIVIFCSMHPRNVIINYFQIDSGKLFKTLKLDKKYYGRVISISPDWKYVAIYARDKIKIFSINGKPIRTLEGLSDDVKSVYFSPDGKYIASSSDIGEKPIKLWSVDGRLIRTFEGRFYNYSNIFFSPCGKYVSSGVGKEIKIWNIDGRLISNLKGHSSPVNSVSISRDGKFIASSSKHDKIKLWSLGGKLIRTIKDSEPGIYSASISPDGKYIVSSSSDEERAIKLWSINGRLIKTLNRESNVFDITFSPNGKYIASAHSDNVIKLWNSKGRLMRTCKGHSQAIKKISFSQNSKYIASGSYDGTVKLWNTRGRLIRTIKATKGHVYFSSIAFNPDSKYVAFSTYNPGVPSYKPKIQLWSINGKLIRTIEGKANDIAFSPDGKYITNGNKLWCVDGKLIRTLEGDTVSVRSVVYTPDGKHIITGSNDTTIKIWDVSTGKCLATLISFKDGTGIVFTPDGRFDYSHHTAKQYVGFVKGMDYIDLNDIFEDFYTPGLLGKVLSGDLPEWEDGYLKKRLQKFARVEIVYPDMDESQFEIDSDSITVGFRVRDGGGGIGRTELRANQKIIWKSDENTDFSKTIEVRVPLIGGVNQISVTAYNRMGGPITEHLTLHRKVYEAKKRSRLFILSVGINKYQQNELSFCVNDAEKITAVIKGRSADFFQQIIPLVLSDREATKRKIQDAFKRIALDAKVEDVVILYFSGHGASVRTMEGKKLFAFLPQDYPWRDINETNLRRFGVHGEFISKQIRLMKPQKVVIIMDCCQSGDIRLALHGTRSAGIDNQIMLERLAHGTGVFLMASAAGNELARENAKIGHGLFTYMLLKGIKEKKADFNKNGVITVTELSSYVNLNFEDEIRRLISKDYRQSPLVDRMGRDELSSRILDFPLVRLQ